jgi:hypothetical protein
MEKQQYATLGTLSLAAGNYKFHFQYPKLRVPKVAG